MMTQYRMAFAFLFFVGTVLMTFQHWNVAKAQGSIDTILQEIWLVDVKEPEPDLSSLRPEEQELVIQAQETLTEFLRRVEGVFWNRKNSPLELFSAELRRQFKNDSDFVKTFIDGEGISSYRIFDVFVDGKASVVKFRYFLRQDIEGSYYIEQRGVTLLRSPEGRWVIHSL